MIIMMKKTRLIQLNKLRVYKMIYINLKNNKKNNKIKNKWNWLI